MMKCPETSRTDLCQARDLPFANGCRALAKEPGSQITCRLKGKGVVYRTPMIEVVAIIVICRPPSKNLTGIRYIYIYIYYFLHNPPFRPKRLPNG